MSLKRSIASLPEPRKKTRYQLWDEKQTRFNSQLNRAMNASEELNLDYFEGVHWKKWKVEMEKDEFFWDRLIKCLDNIREEKAEKTLKTILIKKELDWRCASIIKKHLVWHDEVHIVTDPEDSSIIGFETTYSNVGMLARMPSGDDTDLDIAFAMKCTKTPKFCLTLDQNEVDKLNKAILLWQARDKSEPKTLMKQNLISECSAVINNYNKYCKKANIGPMIFDATDEKRLMEQITHISQDKKYKAWTPFDVQKQCSDILQHSHLYDVPNGPVFNN